MTLTEKKRKIVEKFLEVKFKNLELNVTYEQHSQDYGFYMNTTKYFLGDTVILYIIDNSNFFKVSFCNFFLRELAQWVPVRGKKQFFRDWFFSKYLPNFEYKEHISKKFSYYSDPLKK